MEKRVKSNPDNIKDEVNLENIPGNTITIEEEKKVYAGDAQLPKKIKKDRVRNVSPALTEISKLFAEYYKIFTSHSIQDDRFVTFMRNLASLRSILSRKKHLPITVSLAMQYMPILLCYFVISHKKAKTSTQLTDEKIIRNIFARKFYLNDCNMQVPQKHDYRSSNLLVQFINNLSSKYHPKLNKLEEFIYYASNEFKEFCTKNDLNYDDMSKMIDQVKALKNKHEKLLESYNTFEFLLFPKGELMDGQTISYYYLGYGKKRIKNQMARNPSYYQNNNSNVTYYGPDFYKHLTTSKGNSLEYLKYSQQANKHGNTIARLLKNKKQYQNFKEPKPFEMLKKELEKLLQKAMDEEKPQSVEIFTKALERLKETNKEANKIPPIAPFVEPQAPVSDSLKIEAEPILSPVQPNFTDHSLELFMKHHRQLIESQQQLIESQERLQGQFMAFMEYQKQNLGHLSQLRLMSSLVGNEASVIPPVVSNVPVDTTIASTNNVFRPIPVYPPIVPFESHAPVSDSSVKIEEEQASSVNKSSVKIEEDPAHTARSQFENHVAGLTEGRRDNSHLK